MSRSPELSKKEPVKFPDFEASAVREEFFIARDPFSYNNASMLFSVLPSNNYYPPPESAYPYAISTPPPIPDNWVICFEQPGIERLHTFSLSNSMAPDIEGSMFTPEYFGTTQHINPRQISHGYPEPPSDVPMSNKTMVSFGADKDKEGLAFMNPIMEDQSMEPDSFLWGVDLSITQKHVTIGGTADMGSVEVDGSGGSLSRTHTQSVSKSLSRNGDNRMQTILQTASTQNKALMEQPAGMLEEMSNPNSPPDLSNMSEFEPAISSLPSPRGSKHDSSTNLAGAAAQGENSVPTTYKNFATQNIPLRQRNRNKKERYLCTFEGCQEKKKEFERKCELTYHMNTHNRPHKCSAEGCEKLEGFATLPRFRRHEKKVHRMHGWKELYCPHDGYKEWSARQTNLNAHVENVHIQGKKLRRKKDKTKAGQKRKRVTFALGA